MIKMIATHDLSASLKVGRREIALIEGLAADGNDSAVIPSGPHYYVNVQGIKGITKLRYDDAQNIETIVDNLRRAAEEKGIEDYKINLSIKPKYRETRRKRSK